MLCAGSKKIPIDFHLFAAQQRRITRVRHLEVYGHDSQEGLSGQCVAVNLADEPGRIDFTIGSIFKPTTLTVSELEVTPL